MDHPHHAGFWLNYGNVNSVDFWTNSSTLSTEQQSKMGTVVHQRITRAVGGDRGELTVERNLWCSLMQAVGPTTVKVLDNTGVSGLYHSSEGKTGDAVWGTRARWVMLSGKVNQEAIALVVLDHPKNTGYLTYWHARGYGLFAANPLGQEVFSNGKEKLDFALEPKQSITFRYRFGGPTSLTRLRSTTKVCRG